MHWVHEQTTNTNFVLKFKLNTSVQCSASRDFQNIAGSSFYSSQSSLSVKPKQCESPTRTKLVEFSYICLKRAWATNGFVPLPGNLYNGGWVSLNSELPNRTRICFFNNICTSTTSLILRLSGHGSCQTPFPPDWVGKVARSLATTLSHFTAVKREKQG